MIQKNSLTVIILVLIFFSNPLKAKNSDDEKKIEISDRHIIIIDANQEKINSSYYLGVMNHLDNPKKFSTPVMFPKEMSHFEPQGQVTKEEINLNSSGQITMEKEFRKGLSLVNFGFQIETESLTDKSITFVAPYDLKELSLVVSKTSPLNLSGEGFSEGVPHMLANSEYKGIMIHNMKKGRSFTVAIHGLPEHGKHIWLLGSIFFSLLVGVSTLLTLKTRPKNHY